VTLANLPLHPNASMVADEKDLLDPVKGGRPGVGLVQVQGDGGDAGALQGSGLGRRVGAGAPVTRTVPAIRVLGLRRLP